jgi:TP901 family phage tail tape measure protein
VAEQDEIRVLIRTVADTQGATATKNSLEQVRQSANATSKSVLDFSNGFSLSGSNVVRFGAALAGASIGLSLFAAAGNELHDALQAVIQTGSEFNSTMAGVAAVSGATSEQLRRLSELARTVGEDIGVGAIEGAHGLEELVKGGVSVQEAMGGALRATELLARAGGVTLPQAAEISAVALNSFGLSAAQLSHVADLVAGAANASSIDVEDFRQSLTQAGAVARTIGVSFDDVAVAIAELGQAGIKGSDAGTSIRTFLLSLTPTSQQATDAMRQLGIITREGANQFFDASGKVKSFAEISQVLKVALAGYNDQAKTAFLQTIFGTDAIRSASVFARQGAQGFDTLAASMAKVSAADVAQQRLNSLGGDVDKLGAKAEAAGVQIEKMLDPLLRGAVQSASQQIANLTGQLNDLQKLGNLPTPGALARGETTTAPLPFGLTPTVPRGAGTGTGFQSLTQIPESVAEGLAKVAVNTTTAGQAADTAAPKVQHFGETFSLVDETLRKTHATIAEIAQDITQLGTRSGQLTAIQNALNPRDSQALAVVGAQQALQQIDAQVNAQKALLAIAQEILLEQDATKITDPRDAAGANQAKQRLDILKQLLPAEQALTDAQKQRSDLQISGSQLQVQESTLTLAILPQRQEIARLEQQIADSVDKQVQLRERESILLAQQAALRPDAARDDTQAQIQRDKLLLNIRGTDPDTRRQAFREILDLQSKVLPEQELSAFDADRQVTLAQRRAQAADIGSELQQLPLQARAEALRAGVRPAENQIALVQQQQQQVQLLSQVADALIATRQQAIQVVVNGAVQAVGDVSNRDAATQVATATAQKVFEDVFGQLTEGLGQAQLPPAIQQSGVRR